MVQIDFTARVSELNNYLTILLASHPCAISNIAFEQPREFDVEGVYTISTPDDKEIVYVGKTKSKTVIGRIKDHRTINTNSDLKGMLRLFDGYPQNLDDYLVRRMNIVEPKKRTFLESFLIGVIQPEFNK